MKNILTTHLPSEIIDIILKLTNIKCHTCNKNLNINFYKKHSNFYYCSKKCYEFI
jgi:hypothetical protein